MAKQKKKRSKQYTGQDAAVVRQSVTHISAANRNKVQQWWFDNKRIAKPAGIAVIVAVVVILLLIGLVGILSGHGA